MFVYDSAMRWALCIPFVKVNKENYLRKLFAKKLTPEQMELVLSERPLSVLSMEEVKKIAHREVCIHASLVTVLSFVAALPQSGWLMYLCIIFDFIQFQLIVFLILQKLLYLYGCHNLSSSDEGLGNSANWMLLLISTIMIGKHQMMRMAKSVAGIAVKQAIQRFAVRMMTKLMIYNVLKQIAKWFGIVLTKDMVMSAMNMLVPLTCALISGLISLWLFLPMTNRLERHLTHVAEVGKDPVDCMMEEM